MTEYLNHHHIARAYLVSLVANVQMTIVSDAENEIDRAAVEKALDVSPDAERSTHFKIELPRTPFDAIIDRRKYETLDEIRERAEAVKDANCDLSLSDKSISLFRAAYDRLRLPASICPQIIKVAAAVAKIEGHNNIKVEHLAEAIQYYSYDNSVNEK